MADILVFAAGNERGGAATHLETLVRTYLDEADKRNQLKFHFLTLGTGSLYERLKTTGVSVQVVDGSMTRVSRNVSTILKTFDDVILHAHGPRLNMVASMAARETGTKWTSTIHSNPMLDYLQSRVKTLVYPKLHLRSLKSATGLFVVQEDFARFLPVKTIAFVPNSVILTALDAPKSTYEAALRARLQLPEDAQVVGIAARFDPVKNLPILIEAFSHITSPYVHLAIAGDGAQEKALKAQVSRAGLASRVHFLGYIDDVRSFYAGLNAHVLPSRSEGTPFSLLEAGAYGVPNIGTQIPGITQLLADGVTGLTVPVDNAQGMANAICRVLDNRDLAATLVRQFQQDVLPRFEPRKMLEAYIRGYALFRDQEKRDKLVF